jgi:hypothetical protein
MNFLASVLRDDASLTAVEYAGRRFTEAADLPLKSLETEPMLEWWDKNRNKIEIKQKTEPKPKKTPKKIFFLKI